MIGQPCLETHQRLFKQGLVVYLEYKMPPGDGIRRDIAHISAEERGRLRDAIIKLHKNKFYPGDRNDNPTGGVSYWFKQDEIHAHTHVVCLRATPAV